MQGITDKIMSIDPRLARAECNGQIFNCWCKALPVCIQNPIANQAGQICGEILCGIHPVKVLCVKKSIGKRHMNITPFL